ncbi:MAG: hypothetical protein LPJ89_00535 [Hymenobacteraceae bacterium]|nr:hypothetical protein [Hymenobacteraceae bacterium]
MKFTKVWMVAVVLLIGAAACKKEIDKLLTFYINESAEMQLKSGLVAGTVLNVAPVTVNSGSEDEFENKNTRADMVKDITLERLTLTATQPANADFSFLQSVKIYISTNPNNEVLLAYRDNIPDTVGNVLELTSTKVKLDEYVKAESYKLRTEAKLDKSSRDMTVQSDMRFKVVADPL